MTLAEDFSTSNAQISNWKERQDSNRWISGKANKKNILKVEEEKIQIEFLFLKAGSGFSKQDFHDNFYGTISV